MKGTILCLTVIMSNADLRAQHKINGMPFNDTESIWDLPWIWVGITGLIIISVAIANHLNKNNFK